MSKENRLTIFTKSSSSVYGGRALVLDLTRRINHIYSGSVARHPIEGSGFSRSDHAYNNNIIIGVSGHISNAVAPPPQATNLFTFDPYGQYRNQDAYLTLLEEEELAILKDLTFFMTRQDDPLTQEEIDLLNKYGDEPTTLSAGELLPVEVDEAIQSELGKIQQSLFKNRSLIGDNKALKQNSINNTNLRPLYHTDQASKQLDAFEFLEAIREERLLCDILTMVGLYENMFMTDLQLPRDMGRGCALEVNLRFEQQRFSSVTRSRLSLRANDIIRNTSKGKDQGTPSTDAEKDKLISNPLVKALKGSFDIIKDAIIESNNKN